MSVSMQSLSPCLIPFTEEHLLLHHLGVSDHEDCVDADQVRPRSTTAEDKSLILLCSRFIGRIKMFKCSQHQLLELGISSRLHGNGRRCTACQLVASAGDAGVPSSSHTVVDGSSQVAH